MEKRAGLDFSKITEEIIKRSFPLLENKKIYFISFEARYYSGGAFWCLPFLRFIFISKKKFSKKQLVGLITHELSHFEIFQKRGWFVSIFVLIFYWLCPGFRKKEEIKTDKLVIQKGYAKELFAFRELQNKKISKYYFSPEQIKSYAKKIKDGN